MLIEELKVKELLKSKQRNQVCLHMEIKDTRVFDSARALMEINECEE